MDVNEITERYEIVKERINEILKEENEVHDFIDAK